MELKLDDLDLKPEHRHLNTSKTKFEHFTVKAQRAITAVGRALYIGPRGDTHNAIYPPSAVKKCCNYRRVRFRSDYPVTDPRAWVVVHAKGCKNHGKKNGK